MAPNVCRKKTNENPFFGGHTKKDLHDLCGRKFVDKSRTTTFRQVWGNTGKNPLHPQKFACTCTYVAHNIFLSKRGPQIAFFRTTTKNSFGPTSVATQQLLTHCSDRQTPFSVKYRPSRKI